MTFLRDLQVELGDFFWSFLRVFFFVEPRIVKGI